jgi:hypothetical protein
VFAQDNIFKSFFDKIFRLFSRCFGLFKRRSSAAQNLVSPANPLATTTVEAPASPEVVIETKVQIPDNSVGESAFSGDQEILSFVRNKFDLKLNTQSKDMIQMIKVLTHLDLSNSLL